MTNVLDLTPPGAVAGLHRVDDTGSIRGLEAHRGERLLLVRVPAGMDDVQRWAQQWADELARRAQANRSMLEDRAAEMARQLNMDEAKAREMVRKALDGFGEAVHLAPTDPAAAARALSEGVREAREEMRDAFPSDTSGTASGADASSVAGSIRGGMSQYTQRAAAEDLRLPSSMPSAAREEAEDEVRALRQVATAAKAEAAKPQWQSGEGGP